MLRFLNVTIKPLNTFYVFTFGVRFFDECHLLLSFLNLEQTTVLFFTWSWNVAREDSLIGQYVDHLLPLLSLSRVVCTVYMSVRKEPNPVDPVISRRRWEDGLIFKFNHFKEASWMRVIFRNNHCEDSELKYVDWNIDYFLRVDL